jgi:hypothetical protein
MPFSMRLYHRRKAVATLSSAMEDVTPCQCALEALLGQVKASQLFFHFTEQEVRWCKNPQSGRLGCHLSASVADSDSDP